VAQVCNQSQENSTVLTCRGLRSCCHHRETLFWQCRQAQSCWLLDCDSKETLCLENWAFALHVNLRSVFCLQVRANTHPPLELSFPASISRSKILGQGRAGQDSALQYSTVVHCWAQYCTVLYCAIFYCRVCAAPRRHLHAAWAHGSSILRGASRWSSSAAPCWSSTTGTCHVAGAPTLSDIPAQTLQVGFLSLPFTATTFLFLFSFFFSFFFFLLFGKGGERVVWVSRAGCLGRARVATCSQADIKSNSAHLSRAVCAMVGRV